MAEDNTGLEQGTKPEPTRISRRSLLKGIAGVGLGLVIGQVPESPSIEKKIESRFGVLLTSSKDAPTSNHTTLTDWNHTQMEVLKGILENLPANFYKPIFAEDGTKVPLKLALIKGPEALVSRCLCDIEAAKTSKKNPTVELNKDYYKVQEVDDRRLFKSMIVHELVHYTFQAQSQSPYELGDRISSQIGITSERELPEIFDSQNFEPKFDDRNFLRYAGFNFSEFFAVAGQFYVEGETKFLGLYAPILGEDKAKALYQVMKTEVFQNHEYKNFILQKRP